MVSGVSLVLSQWSMSCRGWSVKLQCPNKEGTGGFNSSIMSSALKYTCWGRSIQDVLCCGPALCGYGRAFIYCGFESYFFYRVVVVVLVIDTESVFDLSEYSIQKPIFMVYSNESIRAIFVLAWSLIQLKFFLLLTVIGFSSPQR